MLTFIKSFTDIKRTFLGVVLIVITMMAVGNIYAEVLYKEEKKNVKKKI